MFIKDVEMFKRNKQKIIIAVVVAVIVLFIAGLIIRYNVARRNKFTISYFKINGD